MHPAFANRELSWLAFNARVLEEAQLPSNPLLERARFLAIVSSNLDEFFMVRVGKAMRRLQQEPAWRDPCGLGAKQLLRQIRRGARRQTARQYALWQNHLLPQLQSHGIDILHAQDLTPQQTDWLANYFTAQILPVLTPRAIAIGRPFPLLASRRIYIACTVRSEKGGLPQLSLVPVPASLPRLVSLPSGAGRWRGILLEEAIRLHLPQLFLHMRIDASLCLRLTRNADFLIDALTPGELVDQMRRNIKRRSIGDIVRLETARDADSGLLQAILSALALRPSSIQRVDGPLDLTFLGKQLHGLNGFDALRYPDLVQKSHPRLAQPQSIFRSIREGDLFFHHPYDSFEPILRLVRDAANDPQVLAIKQTLYRISSKSPLIPALIQAARNGKQVTVLIEVRARFDEENNLNWCKALEGAGCNVLYGVPRWKTHSKITLIIRREGGRLRHYVHVGTGNYNDLTAKAYADFGILTCDAQLGLDAASFFHMVTGYAHTPPLKGLIASPFGLRTELTRRIQAEEAHARHGQPAAIVLKVNSLSDPDIIACLYRAAAAGVKVSLIVRGICTALVPAHGYFRVISIVGRFLEHARAFWFYNGGAPQAFIASADLMRRNLDQRIELAAPVKDEEIAQRLARLLALELSDNCNAWALQPDGSWTRRPCQSPRVDIQAALLCGDIPAVDTLAAFGLSSSHAMNGASEIS